LGHDLTASAQAFAAASNPLIKIELPVS